MRISRHDILSGLYQFALDGGGMVVGKPGIGKTYMLKQLQKKLIENQKLCLIIKIDTAYDSSDEAIQAELDLDSDWIETLKGIELTDNCRAVLIFDAFDAARDEQKRSGFLRQISRAKIQLRDKWDVIVSVRTYDAQKSRELGNIFSKAASNNSFQFYIHELSDEEVEHAFENNNELSSAYQRSSNELKGVLRIPFFLKIFIDIVQKAQGGNLTAIREIHSEIQLLDKYWSGKIDDTDHHLEKEQFLTKFTAALVENRTLSIPKKKIITEFTENDNIVFPFLRSEDILDEVSHQNSRLAYSHNILFDYAVSRYCLMDDYQELISFINEDTSRPFFFRPSFLYFFTSLWYNKRETFWTLFEKLSQSQQREIKLFVRLVLNGTIAAEYLSTDDLLPILNHPNSHQRNEYIANLLQSIRFIRSKTAVKDIDLFQTLSKKLELRFVFEFAFLLDRAIADLDFEGNKTNGSSARNLLNYIISYREGQHKYYLDRIGSTRGIEMIARSYATDIPASSQALHKVFRFIEEPAFDIHYFSSLAEHIKFILPLDPSFVSEVYYLIFGYTETSEEKTSMGQSVVMNLISNRRQDFEMCYYRLEKFFPEFLQKAPVLATETGIDIVNKHLIGKKVSTAHEPITFNYRGKQAVMLPDYSSIWADHRFSSKHEGIAQAAIDYLEELLKAGKDDEVEFFFEAYTSKAEVGYLWKLLFKLSAVYPEQLFKYIYPLIIVPKLLAASETTYEMREFIKQTVQMMSDEQLAQLEQSIFDAFPVELDYSRHASLSMIPYERLQLEASKQFMTGRDPVENEPRYRSSSSVTTYSNDEWLADRGVDIKEQTNSQLLADTNKLDAFSHKFLNETPDYEQQADFLQLAIESFEFLKKQKNLHQDLVYSTLLAITKTAVIFSRNLQNVPNTQFFKIREIVQYGFQYSAHFEDEQNNKSAYGGYSPTPRIEASSALIPIYVREPDNTFEKLIDDAVHHVNGIVRYHVLNELPKLFNKYFDKYQSVLFDRLENETDSFVYTCLLNAIYFKKDRVTEDGEKVIELANRKENFMISRNSFLEAYAELLLWFIAEHELPGATKALQDAYRYPEFCQTIIFKLFKGIKTHHASDVFAENFPALRKKVAIIDHYIDKAIIQINSNTVEFNFEAEENKNVISLFDEVVTRIYFSLERKKRIDNSRSYDANEENRKDLYQLVKPILEKIIQASGSITSQGLIIGPTAHYFIQCLRSVLHFDPRDVLDMVSKITKYSVQANYTFDSFAIREIVSFTEQLLADHRDLLLEEEAFANLIGILDIYINSGWVDALQLLWKLDDVFK